MTDLCTSDARFYNAKNSNYTGSFAAWARNYETGCSKMSDLSEI